MTSKEMTDRVVEELELNSYETSRKKSKEATETEGHKVVVLECKKYRPYVTVVARVTYPIDGNHRPSIIVTVFVTVFKRYPKESTVEMKTYRRHFYREKHIQPTVNVAVAMLDYANGLAYMIPSEVKIDKAVKRMDKNRSYK